jgi:hypothetical protein
MIMMTYDLLGAKLIVEKTQNKRAKNLTINTNEVSILKRIFPFLNYKLDLTNTTDWDLDS